MARRAIKGLAAMLSKDRCLQYQSEADARQVIVSACLHLPSRQKIMTTCLHTVSFELPL